MELVFFMGLSVGLQGRLEAENRTVPGSEPNRTLGENEMKHQNTETGSLRKLRLGATQTLLPLAAVTALVFAACSADLLDPPEDSDVREYALQAFPSCDSLDDHVAKVATDLFVRSYLYSYGGYGNMGGRGGISEPGWEADGEDSAPTSEGGGSGYGEDPASPESHSETNTQEAGVDEPDLLKNDGEFLYVVQDSVLHIVDSFPADEAHEVARFELEGWGENMFLTEDRLTIFSEVWEDAVYDCGYYPCDGGYGGGRPTTPTTNVDPPDVGAPDEESPTPDEEPPTPDDDWTDEPTEYGDPRPPFRGTRITTIDITDRADPQLISTIDIEGSFVNARLVDGIIYLAAMKDADLYYYAQELEDEIEALDLPELDWDTSYEDRVAMEDRLRTLVAPVIEEWVASTGRDALMPDIRDADGVASELFSCSDVMRSGRASDLGMLSVVAFDPNAPEAVQGSALLAMGWQLYGSKNTLYIAQDSRWWYWPDPETRFAETHIHAFDLNAGRPVYTASGAVHGWILNQFSMSEHEGVLRVATTDQTVGGWWWGPTEMDGGDAVDVGAPSSEPSSGGGTSSSGEGSTDPDSTEPGPDEFEGVEPDPDLSEEASNVFVLERNERELEIIGHIGGIAPGESIFAVRFVGDRGFVVTFLQTDPLFTIDLSDPTDPQILGELHIPGFSNYLHPVDVDHLIGIGQDADDNGRTTGLHLQMFDVSDMAIPTRTHHHLVSMGGWSYSDAQHDHRAFQYYEFHGQAYLAIPVTIEDWDEVGEEYGHFSGVILFTVSVDDGFAEAGRVSHVGFATEMYCGEGSEYPGGYDEGGYCDDWGYPWYTSVRRAAFVDDNLFAISNLGVTSSSVDSPDDIMAAVPFF